MSARAVSLVFIDIAGIEGSVSIKTDVSACGIADSLHGVGMANLATEIWGEASIAYWIL